MCCGYTSAFLTPLEDTAQSTSRPTIYIRERVFVTVFVILKPSSLDWFDFVDDGLHAIRVKALCMLLDIVSKFLDAFFPWELHSL